MKQKLPLDIAIMMGCFVITWIDRNSLFNLPSLIQSFLADLICVPLLLFFAISAIRQMNKNPTFFLGTSHIVFAFAWISMMCEWIIPSLSYRYTADWYDVVMYAMGSIYVLWRQKKWIVSETKTAFV